jgi:hypothetical protein
MSSTANHKKAIAITASCYKNRGLLTKLYYKILESQPSAIVNAFEELAKKGLLVDDKPRRRLSGYAKVYICKDCLMAVAAVGIAGACIKCDPQGFDNPGL